MIKIISIRAIRHKNGDPKLDQVKKLDITIEDKDFDIVSKELKDESKRMNGDEFEDHLLVYIQL